MNTGSAENLGFEPNSLRTSTNDLLVTTNKLEETTNLYKEKYEKFSIYRGEMAFYAYLLSLRKGSHDHMDYLMGRKDPFEMEELEKYKEYIRAETEIGANRVSIEVVPSGTYNGKMYTKPFWFDKVINLGVIMYAGNIKPSLIYMHAVKSHIYQTVFGYTPDNIQFPSYWLRGLVELEPGKYKSVYLELEDYVRVDFLFRSKEVDGRDQVMKRVYEKIDRFSKYRLGSVAEEYIGRVKFGFDVVGISSKEKAFFLPVRWMIGSRDFGFPVFVLWRPRGDVGIEFLPYATTYGIYFVEPDPAELIRPYTLFSPYSYVVKYSEKEGWLL